MKHIDLSRLKEIASHAASAFTGKSLIGGGAPRDVHHHVPVKDIDLFVEVEDFDDFSRECRRLASVLNGSCAFSEGGGSVEGAICDIVLPDGHPPIQVIAINRCPFDDVHAYDFGMSQIAVTPKGVLMTDAYLADDIGGTLTYMGKADTPAASIARSSERLARLMKKYPYRDPVNCELLGYCGPQHADLFE